MIVHTPKDGPVASLNRVDHAARISRPTLRFLKDYYMLLFGALVIASVTLMPNGIAGLFTSGTGKWRPRP